MPKFQPWEWIAFAAFATLAAYIAAEPILASSDDCIDALEIFVLLPYYALLYFGTVPALIGIGIWRIAKGRRMSVRSRATLDVTIGVLSLLLLLEVLACAPSPYLTLADRSLDFIPSIVLALWALRIWLSWRVAPGARV